MRRFESVAADVALVPWVLGPPESSRGLWVHQAPADRWGAGCVLFMGSPRAWGAGGFPQASGWALPTRVAPGGRGTQTTPRSWPTAGQSLG